jgi:hypothetical protein
MNTRLRELWQRELTRRALANLAPGEPVALAVEAAALAYRQQPEPDAATARELTCSLPEWGPLFQALYDALDTLPAPEAVQLSLERAPARRRGLFEAGDEDALGDGDLLPNHWLPGGRKAPHAERQ